MTKIKNNICHLLGNRLLIIILFILFPIIIIIGIKKYQIVHSQLYSNLQGIYEIELDSSSVSRAFEVYPLGFIVQVHKDNIRLPTLERGNSKIKNSYKDLVELGKTNNGCWKIVSSMPDSIFIDADAHVLHGKYQVKFRTYQTGSLGYTSDSYLYLDNDSTHLCLRKLE